MIFVGREILVKRLSSLNVNYKLRMKEARAGSNNRSTIDHKLTSRLSRRSREKDRFRFPVFHLQVFSILVKRNIERALNKLQVLWISRDL